MSRSGSAGVEEEEEEEEEDAGVAVQSLRDNQVMIMLRSETSLVVSLAAAEESMVPGSCQRKDGHVDRGIIEC